MGRWPQLLIGLILFACLGVAYPSFVVPGQDFPVSSIDLMVLLGVSLVVFYWGFKTFYQNPDPREQEIALSHKEDGAPFSNIFGVVLSEEVVFRGLIPASLIALGVDYVTAFVGVSFTFFIIHFVGDPGRLGTPQMCYLLGFTTLLACTMLWSGTILVPLVIHHANNVFWYKFFERRANA